MPGFDGTGPRGQGPMTGGGRGYCATGWGLGARRRVGGGRWPRWGGGWGAGWRFDDPPMPAGAPGVADVEALSEQIRQLTSQVESLAARLDASDKELR